MRGSIHTSIIFTLCPPHGIAFFTNTRSIHLNTIRTFDHKLSRETVLVRQKLSLQSFWPPPGYGTFSFVNPIIAGSILPIFAPLTPTRVRYIFDFFPHQGAVHFPAHICFRPPPECGTFSKFFPTIVRSIFILFAVANPTRVRYISGQITSTTTCYYLKHLASCVVVFLNKSLRTFPFLHQISSRTTCPQLMCKWL